VLGPDKVLYLEIITMNIQSRGSKRHKWALDFTNRQRTELAIPPGYIDKSLSEATVLENKPDLIVKKAWDIALGPVKQVPMNLFIMWMAGNSISIFPIMMVGMLFIRPIQALLVVSQTFKMIEGSHAVLQKLVYLLGNLASLALAIYKCQVMGLLPTHPSDWLAFVEPQKRMEWSGGGMVF
jgi:hypothetical protein